MRLTALVLAVVGAAGCAAGGRGLTFVNYEDPAGFQLEHPRGWMVEARGASSIVVRSADQSAYVRISGFVERGRTAAERIRTAIEGAKIGEIRRVSPQWDIVVAPFTAGGTRGNVLCAISGGAGTLMIMAARQSEFESYRSVLGRILGSFRFTAKPAAAASEPLEFTQFRDPRESAFSLSVPRDWRTTGGLFRGNAVDVRPAVETVSGDGRTFVMMGDARIPPFFEMNQQLMWLGFREGQMYSPGYGLNGQISRYVPGEAFAESHARRLAGGTLQVKLRRNRPDLAETFNRMNRILSANPNFQSVTTAGEVVFEAQRRGETIAGYCMAATTRHMALQTAFWLVQQINCYTAPIADAVTAGGVLTRMYQTFTVNPRWAAAQLQTTANVASIVTETNAALSEAYSSTFWDAWKSDDRLSRRREDATMGVVRLVDPGTGQTHTVEAGSNYYGRLAGTNAVIGSNTGDFPPRLDVVPLVQLP
ncbi:MAG: hypothetical protein IT166_24785 [Bryobacterales bacterium]|nr:hypothetical protein [Bryobacterales bacterium]